ncbi:glycosyltransferase family 2 protein [Olivibacter sitiensis]|uniref:glycosyltransferase family 2 protein n=1 Tax=Olivibacter sitiensis TaxID=376470 RepID=UPI000402A008|nr:glycosyltransferase family 2 protein [Olivibacter sitiensis]
MKESLPSVDLSVIIPIYNEGRNLLELYQRLLEVVPGISSQHEYIFVNDGSNDDSLQHILALCQENEHVFYIDLSRNFGQQIAISAGLDIARGKAVVIMDGDLQDPPELIPKLYAKYREGYEVVYARRGQRNGESWFKKYSAKLFYRVMNWASSFEFPLDVGDFRLVDHKVVQYLNLMPEQNKFLRGQIAWLGFKQTAIDFDRDKRKDGKTGYSITKMLVLALDAITSFSDKPLLFVTRSGFLLSGLSFLLILYALFAYFVLQRTISGWTSIMVSSMFLGGIQLISIGIIGEYVRRINKNTQNRPLYIVRDSNIISQKE